MQPLSDRDISRLRAAMAAVRSDSFFTQFRRLLRGRLRFHTFLMMRFDPGQAPTLLGTWKPHGALPPNVLADYFDGAYRLDPFYQFRDLPAGGGLYRLSDIAPDRFFASEYFQHYFLQTGLKSGICLSAGWNPGDLTAAVNYSASRATARSCWSCWQAIAKAVGRWLRRPPTRFR